MTAPGRWLELRTDGAPAALRDCVRRHLRGTELGGNVPGALAEAAERALRQVLGGPGARDVALDLLAADGLITLALLHQAEHDPAGLAALARRLSSQHGAV
jgi:hypothetical protein